jgi:hypothetical protein
VVSEPQPADAFERQGADTPDNVAASASLREMKADGGFVLAGLITHKASMVCSPENWFDAFLRT